MVHDRNVGGIVEAGGVRLQVVARLQHLLDGLGALLGKDDLLLLFVVVEGRGILDQFLHQGIDDPVEVRSIFGGSRDDEGGARLVDQDGVHLVDDDEVVAPLHHLVELVDEVVTEVVEAEFVVGAVGDVGRIGRLALALAEAVDDDADRQSEEAVDLAHPVAVQLGEVVVDGDDMDALARQGVQVDRRGGDQGLALAGTHLGDAALMQDDPADQLDVEMALAEHPPGRLSHHGEGFLQQLVQGLAAPEALTKFDGLGPQRLVAQRLDVGLEAVDLRHPAREGLDLTVI